MRIYTQRYRATEIANKNISMKIIKIIPFHLKSSRFPQKALARFNGVSLLEHALANAAQIQGDDTVLTCPKDDFETVTSSIEIFQYPFTYVPTGSGCICATDRVIQIYKKFDSDMYISLPVDEPVIFPKEINRIIHEIQSEEFGAYTAWCPFYSLDDATSNLSAKVILNKASEMLYLSRAMIPVAKDGSVAIEKLKKNVGVFFFRKAFLYALESHRNTPTSLDCHEGLEQLRWLELGLTVKTKQIEHYGFGIDIPSQIAQLETRMLCLPEQKK